MATTLTYGTAATCVLDSTEAVHLRPIETRCLPADQIAVHVRRQLANPIDYPALADACIPGDRIVLVCGAGIPQQSSVLLGALLALQDAGVEQELTTVLLAVSPSDLPDFKAELANFGFGDCELKIHAPDDEKEIAFLGVSEEGQAIRLNRALCDADLVLPIGLTISSHGSEANATSASLYPTFSDRETQQRCSASNAEHFPAYSSEHANELRACTRQLGVGLSIAVVPGAAGQVAKILAGEVGAVARRAQEEYQTTWSCDVPTQGSLIIATVTGDDEQQSWQNIGRVLAAADTILEPGGTIAICSELNQSVSSTLSHLVSGDDAMIVEREILRTSSTDNGPALQVCRAQQRGAIFLRSQLPSASVESLGITPLESDSELERLAQSIRPCFVMEDAQFLLPNLAEAEA